VAGARLFRVILPVSHIDEGAEFYSHVLGVPGVRVSGGRHYFDCGGTILACFDALADGNPEPIGPNPDYVYFAVDDLESVHERARAAGCREVTAIETQPWGERSFYGRDPFGNPICFVDEATTFTGA
jgi:catechol 2,3-dioxygenase-like lactoylglutathione lyase family enzyme